MWLHLEQSWGKMANGKIWKWEYGKLEKWEIGKWERWEMGKGDCSPGWLVVQCPSHLESHRPPNPLGISPAFKCPPAPNVLMPPNVLLHPMSSCLQMSSCIQCPHASKWQSNVLQSPFSWSTFNSAGSAASSAPPPLTSVSAGSSASSAPLTSYSAGSPADTAGHHLFPTCWKLFFLPALLGTEVGWCIRVVPLLDWRDWSGNQRVVPLLGWDRNLSQFIRADGGMCHVIQGSSLVQ